MSGVRLLRTQEADVMQSSVENIDIGLIMRTRAVVHIIYAVVQCLNRHMTENSVDSWDCGPRVDSITLRPPISDTVPSDARKFNHEICVPHRGNSE